MRLPNGFGQITELRGRRLRKPFRAMITVGHTDEGRPICKLLKPVSYFETYNEAYTALMKYHENPYDMSHRMTLEELFNRWIDDEGLDGRNDKSLSSLLASWQYCIPLYKKQVSDIRAINIKDCIDNACIETGGKTRVASSQRKRRIVVLLKILYDYAIKYDITDKNPARQYKLPKAVSKEAAIVKKEHIAFSEEEMNILWEHSDDTTVKLVLIQCYSGWRPTELLEIKTENVNIKEWYFVGGMKTKAGTNRTVPIHSKIRNLVISFYNPSQEYLFMNNSKPYTYFVYRNHFSNMLRILKLDFGHRPHDPRKWFISTAKEKHMNDYAIKRIVGHNIGDVTENIYTERKLDWLMEEIEKL